MEDKKKTNAKKKTNPNRPAPHKVKEAKVQETHAEFADVEDDGDKRLIVFIAIAILVIVGTIIGLLVGCEKKKEPEPEKPVDDIVVPEKKDDKEANEGVRTKEIVRKVKSVYKAKKTSTNNTSNNTTTTKTYGVTFYINEKGEKQDVDEGATIPEYVPSGYSSCEYFEDSNHEIPLDMSTTVTGDMNVYMVCELITYTVEYHGATTSNPTTYTVEDGTVTLADAETEQVFNGWFLEETYGTKVTALTEDIIDAADSSNVIHLYAYITEEPVEGFGETGDAAPLTGMAAPEEEVPEEEPEFIEGEPEEGRRAVVEDTFEEEPEEKEAIVEEEPEEKEEEIVEEVPEEEKKEEEMIPEEEEEEEPEEKKEEAPEVQGEPEEKKEEEPEKEPEEKPAVEEQHEESAVVKEEKEEDKKPEAVIVESGESDKGKKAEPVENTKPAVVKEKEEEVKELPAEEVEVE